MLTVGAVRHDKPVGPAVWVAGKTLTSFVNDFARMLDVVRLYPGDADWSSFDIEALIADVVEERYLALWRA